MSNDDDNTLGSFSIRIVDENQQPMSGVAVGCSYCGLGSEIQYTNNKGWATFPIYGGTIFSSQPVGVDQIYVNEIELMDFFYPEDGQTESFEYPWDDE